MSVWLCLLKYWVSFHWSSDHNLSNIVREVLCWVIHLPKLYVVCRKGESKVWLHSLIKLYNVKLVSQSGCVMHNLQLHAQPTTACWYPNRSYGHNHLSGTVARLCKEKTDRLCSKGLLPSMQVPRRSILQIYSPLCRGSEEDQPVFYLYFSSMVSLTPLVCSHFIKAGFELGKCLVTKYVNVRLL